MHSIKTKLAAGMCVLIALLFALAAWTLVNEKRSELSTDIYVNARNFAELSSKRITTLYDELLKEYSFVLFNREITDVFHKNTDISAIRIYSYAGEILYNSQTEQYRQYVGQKRMVIDAALVKRIKSQLLSVSTTDNRTVYLKKNSLSDFVPVDEFEHAVKDVGVDERGKNSRASTELITTIIYPLEGKFAVEFVVSYDNLEARVKTTTERIIYLTLFGILVGLGAAVYFALRITRPIEDLTLRAQELGTGNLKVRVTVQTNDEIGKLATTFNKMASDLEISTAAMVERQKIAKELELAAKIQGQIIPKEVPSIPGLQVATALIPAEEVGGDCYDFIALENNRNIFYISDVTGHGVPAGLVVSIANALIYSFADQKSIKDLLVHVNRVMRKKTSQNMNMTLLMLDMINTPATEPTVKMVSAGHPEMLHYVAATNAVECEKGGGIALGMIPEIEKLLSERSLSLAPGDIYVLYSDGIPECGSESGEMFGMDRFKATLARAIKNAPPVGEGASNHLFAESIRDAIIADVKAFMGSSKQLDDITLVVLARRS